MIFLHTSKRLLPYILSIVLSSFALSVKAPAAENDVIDWPIRAPKYISATFGEPRPGRFHMGLDFKSGGAIGKEVYTLGDGHVVRVRTSPYGYGKGLYIKLDSGETLVYGHLSRFMDEIEDDLFSMRIKKGSYDIDWYPEAGTYPVKKGQIVAWSGDTGSGGPHFHLEIRDKDNFPVNPLDYGFKVRDTVKPTVGAVLLVPLDTASYVNGLSRPLLIEFDKNGKKPVIVNGRVGVAVAAYDRANNARNKLGLYHVEMYIDSTKVFTKNYSRISYSEDKFGGFDNFPGRRTNGNGYLSALYRQKGNDIAWYEGDGTLSLNTLTADSLHTVSIRCADYMGNENTRSFTVRYAGLPVLSSCSLHGDGKMEVAGHYYFGVLDKLVVEAGDKNGAFTKAAEIPLSASSFSDTVDVSSSNAVQYRVSAHTADGLSSMPLYLSVPKSGKKGGEIKLDTQILHDRIFLRVTADRLLSSLPQLGIVRDGVTLDHLVPFAAENGKSWAVTVAVPRNGHHDYNLLVTAVAADGDTVTCESDISIDVLEKGVETAVCSPDSILTLEFGSGSLYRSMPVEIETATPRKIRNLRRHSDIYHINCGDYPLAGSYSFSFGYDGDLPEKAALFYSGNGSSRGIGWRFLSSEYEDGVFLGTMKGSGYVAVLEDRLMPWVAAHSPKPGASVSSKRPRIRARLEDTGSGLGGSDSIEMSIDGVAVYGAYDPEQKWVTYVPRNPLKSGSHVVKVKATDRVGNEKEISWKFSVQ